MSQFVEKGVFGAVCNKPFRTYTPLKQRSNAVIAWDKLDTMIL
jgi:hypothetical protein